MAINRYVLTADVTVPAGTAATIVAGEPGTGAPAGPGNVPTTSSLLNDGLGLVREQRVEVLALSGDDRLLPLLAAAREAGLPVALIAHACQPDGPCLALAATAEPAAAFARPMTRAERYRRSPSVA